MTTPLWCLVVVALIPYVLSFAGAYFRMRQLGSIDNKHPRQQAAKLEGVGARAYAAQQNAWEALPFFTAGVVVSQLAGADPAAAASLSLGYLATRILHPIVYLANLDVLRSLVFGVGLVCVVGLFWISI